MERSHAALNMTRYVTKGVGRYIPADAGASFAPRSRNFAHADSDVAIELLKSGLDPIDPRRVIETEQPVHLLAVPAEPAREFGAGDAGIAHRHVKLSLERNQQRQLHPRPPMP